MIFIARKNKIVLFTLKHTKAILIFNEVNPSLYIYYLKSRCDFSTFSSYGDQQPFDYDENSDSLITKAFGSYISYKLLSTISLVPLLRH